jgi:hypothetical protein
MTSTEPQEPESTSGSLGGSSGSPGDSTLKAWLWVLGGLVVVLAVVLVVVLITQDDDSGSASNTTTTRPTTTTLAPTTTTAVPTTTTTTTAPPPPTTTLPLPPVTDDPQSYAEYLFAAWQNANKTAAANVASSDAVDQIFAQPYSASSQWAFQMCDPAAGSLYCTWNGTNNTKLLMTVRTLTGGLPVQVVMVQFQTA